MPSGIGEVNPDAKLQFLELCAGSHRLTDCAMEYGLAAHAFDAPKLNKITGRCKL